MNKKQFGALALMSSAIFVVAVLAQMAKEPVPYEFNFIAEEGKLPRYEVKLNVKPDQSSARALVETYCNLMDNRSAAAAVTNKAESEFRAWRSEFLASYESRLKTEAMQKEVLKEREWDPTARRTTWRGAAEIVGETEKDGVVIIETRQLFRDPKAVRPAANNSWGYSNSRPSNRAYSNRAYSNRAWSNEPSTNKSWSMQGNGYGNAPGLDDVPEQEDRMRFTCVETDGVWRISLIEKKTYMDDSWGDESGMLAFLLLAGASAAGASTDLPKIALEQASAEDAAKSLAVSLLTLYDDISFGLELRMFALAFHLHLQPLLTADYIAQLAGKGRDFPRVPAPPCRVDSSSEVNGATRVVLLFEPEDAKAPERRVYVDSVKEGDKWLVRECGWVNNDRDRLSYDKARNPYYLR
jgi:hypothetical protein